jgi:DNA polymerase (family X)
MREMAVRRGASISEIAVTEADGTARSFPDEEALYAHLGLPWIPPELREDVGELTGPLPPLVELGDVRGDLQMHTDASDGRATLSQMAAAAAARGYAYVAITDHSQGLAMAGGLSPERVKRQWEAIDTLNAGGPGVRVLKGVELELLADGRLDFDDELLAGFDVVIASIHSGFQQGSERVTERLLAAIESPHVDIIGHPTGRRLGRRPPLEFDTARVFERAAATGTLLEINGQEQRLDLNDRMARDALAAGCRLVVSSDAHSADGLSAIAQAITVARRAGARAGDIANTASDWRG